MNNLVFVWSFLLLSSLGSAFCLSAGIYLFCRCIGIRITATTLVVRKDEESNNGYKSKALMDVIAERQHQIEVEGFSAGRDDQYLNGELTMAAVAYAKRAAIEICHDDFDMRGQIEAEWPWDRKWWKPTNTRRSLVKAAALIIAQIESIDRKESGHG